MIREGWFPFTDFIALAVAFPDVTVTVAAVSFHEKHSLHASRGTGAVTTQLILVFIVEEEELSSWYVEVFPLILATAASLVVHRENICSWSFSGLTSLGGEYRMELRWILANCCRCTSLTRVVRFVLLLLKDWVQRGNHRLGVAAVLLVGQGEHWLHA